jgi:hypothetical protein
VNSAELITLRRFATGADILQNGEPGQMLYDNPAHIEAGNQCTFASIFASSSGGALWADFGRL